MVLIVWSEELAPGFKHAIITILDFISVMKESLRTIVSFEALNGI